MNPNPFFLAKIIGDIYMTIINNQAAQPKLWQYVNFNNLANQTVDFINAAVDGLALTKENLAQYVDQETLEDTINFHLYNHCASIEERALSIINDQNLQDWRTNDQSWNTLINALAINEGVEYGGCLYLERDSRLITAQISNPVDVYCNNDEEYEWDTIGLAYISGL